MNADEKIWRYLKSAGLNDFGVAGLMGIFLQRAD